MGEFYSTPPKFVFDEFGESIDPEEDKVRLPEEAEDVLFGQLPNIPAEIMFSGDTLLGVAFWRADSEEHARKMTAMIVQMNKLYCPWIPTRV